MCGADQPAHPRGLEAVLQHPLQARQAAASRRRAFEAKVGTAVCRGEPGTAAYRRRPARTRAVLTSVPPDRLVDVTADAGKGANKLLQSGHRTKSPTTTTTVHRLPTHLVWVGASDDQVLGGGHANSHTKPAHRWLMHQLGLRGRRIDAGRCVVQAAGRNKRGEMGQPAPHRGRHLRAGEGAGRGAAK